MTSLRESLQVYLTHLLGEDGHIAPLLGGRLPVHLDSAYELLKATLHGQQFVLALSRAKKGATPAQLAKDRLVIEEAIGKAVAFVLPGLLSRDRRRLIQARIPFVVPDRQLYLPMFLIDLREHNPRPKPERPEALAWATQLLLLRHLLFRDVEGRSLGQLANKIGYSAMTISNAHEELVAAELCELVIEGRRKRIRFEDDARGLWERAQSVLRSPVREVVPMDRWPEEAGLPAGISALARQTNLGKDSIPTVALYWKSLRNAPSVEFHDEYPRLEPVCYVQKWRYDPQRLAGEVVDPLSLHLSLRDDEDDRVQIALDELLEQVAWR